VVISTIDFLILKWHHEMLAINNMHNCVSVVNLKLIRPRIISLDATVHTQTGSIHLTLTFDLKNCPLVTRGTGNLPLSCGLFTVFRWQLRNRPGIDGRTDGQTDRSNACGLVRGEGHVTEASLTGVRGARN